MAAPGRNFRITARTAIFADRLMFRTEDAEKKKQFAKLFYAWRMLRKKQFAKLFYILKEKQPC